MCQKDSVKRGHTGRNVDGDVGKIRQQRGRDGRNGKYGCGRRDSLYHDVLGFTAATTLPKARELMIGLFEFLCSGVGKGLRKAGKILTHVHSVLPEYTLHEKLEGVLL